MQTEKITLLAHLKNFPPKFAFDYRKNYELREHIRLIYMWKIKHERLVLGLQKQIEPLTDINYWQKFLYCVFGNRRIADVQDEDTLVCALADECKKVLALLGKEQK